VCLEYTKGLEINTQHHIYKKKREKEEERRKETKSYKNKYMRQGKGKARLLSP
jgi:hypothetical protein